LKNSLFSNANRTASRAIGNQIERQFQHQFESKDLFWRVGLMIKRVLLGLGGTPFTDVAIQRAVELAKIYGALITGVTVVDTKRLKQVGPVPPGGGIYAAKLREKRVDITEERIGNAIQQFKAKCDEADIPFKIERETGDLFETMIAHARYNDVTIFGLKSVFD
jgi:nucleotide-binding universal stress UspA family protein